MTADFSFLKELDTDRSSLIKGLQLVQQKEGYVSDEAIEAVAAYFGMAPAEVEGVLTFYAQFKRIKPGRFQISVCDGTACHIKGSPQIQQWLEAELGIKDGETTKDGLFTLKCVACLGCCSLSPVMMINDETYGSLTPEKTINILNELRQKAGDR